jgi:predicted membrane protein
MFSKIMDIWRFIPKLTRLMNKRMLRSLSSLIGLYILSIVLSLPHAISAPSQVEHNASINPLTIVQVAAMTLPSQIFRRWTHSREEDRADILVYRPQDYPFPPARGREGLEFRENGEFIRYQIGPTDRSLAVPGRWSIQNTNVVEVQFPNQSVSSYILTILECDEQILKVRQTAGGTSQ